MNICASSYKLNSKPQRQALLRHPPTIHIPRHAAHIFARWGAEKHGSALSSSGMAIFCLDMAQLDELSNFQISQRFQ